MCFGTLQLSLLFSSFWLFMQTASSLELLVFGGNGFIGSHVVEQLLAEGHNLTLANRGRWSWDSGAKIKPFVETIYCDRHHPSTFDKLVERLGSKHFDAVVDFSAYRVDAVTPFYSFIKQSCDLYIYISTDSVYEVCDSYKDGEFLTEEDAKRPVFEEKRKEFNNRDKYGHHKLEVEEYLMSEFQKDGVPYVILRLPDVLGERDSTERFWKYVLWLEFSSVLQIPVAVPSFSESLRTSYVDAKDVGRMIRLILLRRDLPTVRNQVFNCGFPIGYKLRELLSSINDSIKIFDQTGDVGQDIQDSQYDFSSSGDYFFPSVTKGALNTSKLQRALDFTATNWDSSISRIVRFYMKALTEFPTERKMVVQTFLDEFGDQLSAQNHQRFLEAINWKIEHPSFVDTQSGPTTTTTTTHEEL